MSQQYAPEYDQTYGQGYEEQGYEQSYDEQGYVQGYAQEYTQDYAQEQYYAETNQQQQQQQYYQEQPQQEQYPNNITPPEYSQFCMTVNAFPQSSALRVESRLPYAAVIQPLARTHIQPQAINFGPSGVIRCRACRAYINAYASFTSSGTNWACNLCGRTNDLPTAYVQETASPEGRAQHPELSQATFEIVAPPEYTVRAPQPPTFVFVIDVSERSSVSGVLSAAVNAIYASLDSLPGGARTNIGFVTFDSSVHYYSLAGNNATVLVLPDLSDVYLPMPGELLVNLSESRAVVEQLLDSLPRMYAGNKDPENCAGSAVQAASQLAKSIGGKIVLFSTALPTLGSGSLTNRDNPRLLGTDKEHSLLLAATPFYRDLAQTLTTNHLMADVFLFPDQYSDVATMGELAKHSGGQLRLYPGFHESSDSEALLHDLFQVLSREQAWEAVMRVRASRGVKVHNYFGHFHMRSHDLLSVPNCDADKCYVVEFVNDENAIPTAFVTFQSALLYSNSDGERRLRIHTYQVPVVKDAASLFAAADSLAIANYSAKKALGNVQQNSLHSARELIQYLCTDIVSGYTKAQPGFAKIEREEDYPDSLRYLPFYTLSLLKNIAFKDGTDVSVDTRSAAHLDLGCMGMVDFDLFVRPRLYRVDQLGGPEGILDEYGGTMLPQELNLTSAELSPEMVTLMDNGRFFYIRVGGIVSPQILDQLFEDGSRSRKLTLRPRQGDGVSPIDRLYNVMDFLRYQSSVFQTVHVFREGDPSELRFYDFLIYDRTPTVMGYEEFLMYLSGRR